MARMPPRKTTQAKGAAGGGARRATRSTPIKSEDKSQVELSTPKSESTKQKKRVPSPDNKGEASRLNISITSPSPTSKTAPTPKKNGKGADKKGEDVSHSNISIIKPLPKITSKKPPSPEKKRADKNEEEVPRPSVSTIKQSPTGKPSQRSDYTIKPVQFDGEDSDDDDGDDDDDDGDDDEDDHVEQEEASRLNISITSPSPTSKTAPTPNKKGKGADKKGEDVSHSNISIIKPSPTPSKKAPSPEKKRTDKNEEEVPRPSVSTIKQSLTDKPSQRRDNTIKSVQVDDEDSDDDGDDDEEDDHLEQEEEEDAKFDIKIKNRSSSLPKSKTSKSTADVSISDEELDPDQEAELRKSKKMKTEHLKEGMNVFALMDSSEIKELLNRIDQQCSLTDNYAVRKREKALNWEQVAFSSYGDRQCKAVWAFLKHRTRTYRIMSEVVAEVKFKFTSDRTYQTKLIESLPGFPEKPPTTGGFYFNREQWNKMKERVGSSVNLPNWVKFQRECRIQYDVLADNVKEKYDTHAKLMMAEYLRKVKKFYAENPGLAEYISKLMATEVSHSRITEVRPKRQRNPPISGRPRKIKSERIDPYADAPQYPHSPAVNFMQAKLNDINPPPTQEEIPELKQEVFKKWTKLSERKHKKWIDHCIQECIAYIDSAHEYQEAHPGWNIPGIKINQLLTKDELAIWGSANGKPSNPRANSSETFIGEFLQSEENNDLPDHERREIALQKWNELDWYSKDMYTMKFKVMHIQYKKDLEDFFAKIPEFMRTVYLKTIPKKYIKMLTEVDKVPSNEAFEEESSVNQPNELLITAEEGVVYGDGHIRKAKKRKHAKIEEESETNETHDEYEQFPPGESNEIIPKKKKKKKKHIEHNEDSDIQQHSEYPESSYLLQGEHTRTAEKAKKVAKAHSDKMMKAGDRVAYTLEEDFVEKHKSSAKFFPENNTITKNDIYESMRGIFDARAIGRRYSIYYYYAKYVAADRVWIDSVNTHNLEQTAFNIIQTFLGLPGVQQDIFIHKSFTFHDSKRHPQDFPDEPKPPLKSAKSLYRRQVTKKKKRNPKFVAPTWTELPSPVQLYYTKQLYHETKLYMRRYDDFISSMTPSDFVEYAIYRYKMWEGNLYTKQSLPHAFRQFVFPFSSGIGEPRQSMIDASEEGELEATSTSSKKARQLNNPLTKNKAVDTMLTRLKIPNTHHSVRSRQTGKLPKNENIAFSLLLDKADILRAKIKKAEMYDYPMDDMLGAIYKEPPSPEKRMKRICQGTQTVVAETRCNCIVVVNNVNE